MSRFQLWDVPSSTLLEETDDAAAVACVVESFVESAGPEVLDDLGLSDATLGETPAASYSGKEIVAILQTYIATEMTQPARSA